MKLLTNYPLEMFGARSEFPFSEIKSFGPSTGRVVGDVTLPYDITFDASTESLTELIDRCATFSPDAIMMWWPDQDPLPIDFEASPVPTIAVVSDYNLTLPLQRRLWPFFDLVLCDHSALSVLGRLPFAAVEPWCQFSFRPDVHHGDCDARRDLDVSFLGNLHPVVQRDRLPWLRRLQALEDRFAIHIGTATQGAEYGKVLARSKIAFNRSVRGEINLRCFEAAACGALVFCERENHEVREYFREDEEIVFYGPDDFEQKITWFLEHDETRRRLAAAGQRRVREHRLAKLCAPLPERFARLSTLQRPVADPVTRLLGRAEAMLLARSPTEALLAPLTEALRIEESNRTLSSLAIASATRLGIAHDDVTALLQRAHDIDREHIPSLANLAYVRSLRGESAPTKRLRAELAERASCSTRLRDFDGLVLPIGFQSRFLAHSAAFAEMLRTASLAPMRRFFLQLAQDRDPEGPMPGFEEAVDFRQLYEAPLSPKA